ncbi:Uma2 family endonuclease [Sphingobacteriales bacterium UPWRP_1]|nr:hypothetical protein BVG80_11685 [Sphingobacteriales bacterium TSM_CSM]PSJ72771.1 Uma2 family endonuclease [Sphingobacteriales bacterium UPWRP_1]
MEVVTTQPQTLTAEEYLSAERAAIREKKGKHEFFNGEIISISGATINHNIIAMNLYLLLGMVRKDKNISVFSSDLRIFNPINNSFCYPDVCVVQGAPQMTDNNRDILLNPLLLIEVLSESTEKYDRGDKLKIYRSIPSVREYVLIAQDTCGIESYFKTDAGEWLYSEISDAAGQFTFQSIGLQIAVSQVYEGVVFTTNTPPA